MFLNMCVTGYSQGSRNGYNFPTDYYLDPLVNGLNGSVDCAI